ncbi:radical SAM protein [Patescibacteria group bacterium]|nr:radical SAM protein [Patescibacteria group bacterium]
MTSIKNLYFNKDIYRLRLAVTTACVLRCKYCFVRKTNKVIPYQIAIKAINLLLESRGSEKLLMIYGGEPLLCFDVLKRIINFAQNKARLLNKSLIISIGTNGVLLNQEKLDFFKKTNIKLAISLDGQKKFHNKARVLNNKKGSFDLIFDKLPLVFKNIKKENACVLFGVLPSSAHAMYDNLVYLNKLGFDSINIEPIESPQFKWKPSQQEIFLINLIKFTKLIEQGIQHGSFIFMNSVNRELRGRKLTDKKNLCPFFRNLEVYPEGEIIFSPLLINSKDKDRYIIGSIKSGFLKKYTSCYFSPNSGECKNCKEEYLFKEKDNYSNSEDVLNLRNSWSIKLSQKILSRAKTQPVFKRYIREAKKRVFE